MSTPIEKAITAAGGQAELAKRLKVSPQAVHKWKGRGLVPATRVLQVEIATGGAVSRHELRPDLYPMEKSA